MKSYLSPKQQIKKEQVKNKPLLVKLKLNIGAGLASMTPPLGPVLGQYGINIMEFCNEYNTESAIFEKGVVLKVILYINVVKGFYFEILQPKLSLLVKEHFKEEFIKSSNAKIYVDKHKLLRICYRVALYQINLNIKSKTIENEQFIKSRIFELLGNCKSMGIFIK